MIDQTQTMQTDLAAIVGAEHVQPATHTDAIDGVQPQIVVAPGDADEVGRVLRLANDAGLRVVPRGGGSKLGWGNVPQGVDLVLSLNRLNEVLEHTAGDMTATVQAGCTVAEFQRTLAEHGQHLALDPLWPEQATIGGILATNDSGAMRMRFGSLRDLIIGITIALPDGTLAKSGGKVVKNVAGYDLPKLMTGALGTLGVITDANFRLYPLPKATRIVTVGASSVAAAQELMLKILDSTLVPTGVQLHAGFDSAPRIDVRFEGLDVAIESQVSLLREMRANTNGIIDAEPTQHLTGREGLWEGGESALICKVNMLPAQFTTLMDAVLRVAKPLRLRWELITQAIGVSLLRLDGANEQALLAALNILRTEVEQLEGALVVLHAPPDVKSRIDVWGVVGDAGPIMRRVKDHFDPNNILNAGRYLRF